MNVINHIKYHSLVTIFFLFFVNSIFASNAVNQHSGRFKFWNHSLELQFQGGGFWIEQGKPQFIKINGLEGDYFNLTKRHDSNGLAGLGLYARSGTVSNFQILYGVNVFYLAETKAQGIVKQELLFDNLSYQFTTQHVPIYFALKALSPAIGSYPVHLTFDAGIGPNIVMSSSIKEYSLDDGITLPDHPYYGKTHTTFSANTGLGIRSSQFPLECGYRFYYLGKGSFSKRTPELLSSFGTGNIYSNALVCSIFYN